MSSFPKELCIPLRSSLNQCDTDEKTYGCRHTNPDICGYCFIEGTCAFTADDKICKHPSKK